MTFNINLRLKQMFFACLNKKSFRILLTTDIFLNANWQKRIKKQKKQYELTKKLVRIFLISKYI